MRCAQNRAEGPNDFSASFSFGRNYAHFVLGSDKEHDNIVEAAFVQLVAREATTLVNAANVLHEHLCGTYVSRWREMARDVGGVVEDVQ